MYLDDVVAGARGRSGDERSKDGWRKEEGTKEDRRVWGWEKKVSH